MAMGIDPKFPVYIPIFNNTATAPGVGSWMKFPAALAVPQPPKKRAPRKKDTKAMGDDEFFAYTEKWRKYYEGKDYQAPVLEEEWVDEDVDYIPPPFPKITKALKKVNEQLTKKYANDPNVDVY
jgi:hypothetical protein